MVISLINPNEHAITIFGFTFFTVIIAFPFILATAFVKLKLKFLFGSLALICSLTITSVTYIHNVSPEAAFKRIVISPIPSSVRITNVKVNDATTFLEFECSKVDMKKILMTRAYSKSGKNYGWGEQKPKWLNEQELNSNFEMLVEESVGSWIRAIYISKDSTKAIYIIFWY